MQPFESISQQRRKRQDVAPTGQPAAAGMQILNARPHHANRALQPDTSFNQPAYANVNLQSPEEVDFLGFFEDDLANEKSQSTASVPLFPRSQGPSRNRFVSYPPAAQGITEPCADINDSDFDFAHSPGVVDFDGSASFGHVSCRPFSDPRWLERPLCEANQPTGSEGVYVSNNSIQSLGTTYSLATCPSLTDHSWNSSINDVRSAPRSYAPSSSFCGELSNSSFASFLDQGEGFGTYYGPDTENSNYTWRNTNKNESYAAVNAFPQSELQNDGLLQIPPHSTYNAGSRNLPQPNQFRVCEEVSLDFDFPTEQTSLSRDEAQHLQFEIEELPQGLSARSNPLNVPINTKHSVVKETTLATSNDTTFSYDCFVMGNDFGGNLKTELPQHKGIRTGPLSRIKKETTAERRKKGTTCMRCRTMRVECDGGNPCQKCIKAAESLSLMYPCIKASFLEIVNSGTCNYISQRAINHFTLDQSRRIQMFLPKEFNLDQLLNLLSTRRRAFNIRARQATGSLYVLDLAKCYSFLRGIRRGLGSSRQGDLRTFIDNTLVESSPWRDCVRECDPVKDKVALLSKWNNMPSRASYDLVSLENDVPDRPLDPEDDQDREEIMIAAQVSRIICRKAEIDGYRALQTAINNAARSPNPDEKIQFVQELGRILCSLRWRMSWWELLGDGSHEYDPFRDRFIDRVRLLSRVLYFYFFTVKDKIAPWYDIRGLQGVWSSYPDSRPVFDDFPIVCSIEAFAEWMDRGKGLIREADVQGRFSR